MSTGVPKLRFPDFDKAWISQALGDVAVFSKGKGISKAEIVDGGSTPCIRYGELYTIYGTDIDDVVSYTDVPSAELAISLGGEVIVPASGETAEDIATAAVVRRPGVALGGDLNILRSELDGGFLSSYLSGKKRGEISRMAQGNSVVHLYGAQLAKLNLRIPVLDEQRKIATFLGAVDSKIDALRRKKAALTRFKAGLAQKMFSQELRFTREDRSAFPDWESLALGEFVNFSKGAGVSKADIDPGGSTPCIRYGELYTTYGAVIDDVRSRTSVPANKLVISVGNEVLIPSSGETAADIATASVLMHAGVAIGGDLNVLRSTQDGRFLAEYLRSELKTKIASLSQGNSVVHLYAAQLARLAIKLPSLDEQRKIADALSALDAKISAAGAQMAQMETFKKGLLEQMFA